MKLTNEEKLFLKTKYPKNYIERIREIEKLKEPMLKSMNFKELHNLYKD